ncbi:regulatory ArsR family protein [Fontibacillus phaseoli]|uniref:Regulatory ArsR family protein n=2 Tax=Fontibacillus phaseoli TaxID=1416533 RepID=A0A369BBI5_9BACL|nr:regulatory ArsR family protein [Fontibacillus phaseoli]
MITVLKLLADKTRLTILAILKDGERCVCDLVDALQTTQPNISQHLRKLREAGLVKESRRGQWSYYMLMVEDKPYVQAVMDAVPVPEEALKLIGTCADGDCCN